MKFLHFILAIQLQTQTYERDVLNLRKPETFGQQIWITNDPGDMISFQFQTQWEDKLKNFYSPKDVINASPSTDCPVCFEDLSEKDDIVAFLDCRHVLCKECHLTNFYREKKSK